MRRGALPALSAEVASWSRIRNLSPTRRCPAIRFRKLGFFSGQLRASNPQFTPLASNTNFRASPASRSVLPHQRQVFCAPTRIPRRRIHQWPSSRRPLFRSIASAAESFRSTCGSERGPPECSKQRAPAPTPHVGHGTESNCFAVKSPILIPPEYGKYPRKTVLFQTPRDSRREIAVSDCEQTRFGASATITCCLTEFD